MSVKGMKFTLTHGCDVVKGRVVFLHVTPMITIVRHMSRENRGWEIILCWLLWHVSLGIVTKEVLR